MTVRNERPYAGLIDSAADRRGEGVGIAMSLHGEEMQESDRELLIRLDERVRAAVTTMEQRDIYHRQEMDRLTKLMMDQQATFTSGLTTMAANFASKADLSAIGGSITRVERIVYGACALILVAVIGALMAGILPSPSG